MRYRHIKEGIRMGAKDLASKPKKDYTIGFEFEVELDKDYIPSDYSENDISDDSDDLYDQFQQNYSPTSFNKWFDDNNLKIINSGKLQEYFEPRYGYADEVFSEWLEKQPEDFKKSIKSAMDNSIELNLHKDDIVNYIRSFGTKYAKIMSSLEHIDYVLQGGDETKMEEYLAKKEEWWIEVLKRIQSEEDSNAKNLIHSFIVSRYKDNLGYIARKKGGALNPKGGIDDRHLDIFINEEQSDYDTIRSAINSVEDVVEFFDVDEDGVEEAFRDEYEEFISEEEREAFDEYQSDYYNQNSGNNPSDSVEIVGQLVEDTLGVDVEIENDDYNKWCVVSDQSLSFGAEITSPVQSLERGISNMHRIFKMIERNNEWVETKSNTGLHVNIGTWEDDDWNKIDWLKFIIVANVGNMLVDFERQANGFCRDSLGNIIKALEGDFLMDYLKNISKTNEKLIHISRQNSKGYAVNLGKLVYGGHIEIRAFGNKGYENKGELIERYVRKIIRALEIASDPNAYRNEYLKKLYSLFGEWMASVEAVSKDDKIKLSRENRENYNLVHKIFGTVNKNVLNGMAKSIIEIYNKDKESIDKNSHNTSKDIKDIAPNLFKLKQNLESTTIQEKLREVVNRRYYDHNEKIDLKNIDKLKEIYNDKFITDNFYSLHYILSFIIKV